MSRASKSAALFALAVLALAGCTAEAPAPSAPEVSTAPAAGETISGTGYTFVVPEDWGIPEQGVPGFEPDSLAADLDDADGFVDNVNVILSPAGEVLPEQVETAGVDELEAAGATDVTVEDRVTIAGSESAHVAANLAAQGVEYRIDQYYVTADEQTYVVTFSFSTTVSEADRDEIAGSILSTWTWT